MCTSDWSMWQASFHWVESLLTCDTLSSHLAGVVSPLNLCVGWTWQPCLCTFWVPGLPALQLTSTLCFTFFSSIFLSPHSPSHPLSMNIQFQDLDFGWVTWSPPQLLTLIMLFSSVCNEEYCCRRPGERPPTAKLSKINESTWCFWQGVNGRIFFLGFCFIRCKWES